MTILNKLIEEYHSREHMSGVDRDDDRTKATGEIFTPSPLVEEILGKFPQEIFSNETKTILDPTCGDGQFLVSALILKMQHGISHDVALSTIFGVDIMIDNCLECIKRLYLIDKSNIKILVDDDIPADWKHKAVTAVFEINGIITNIVCADGISYNYKFYEQVIDPDPVPEPKPKKEPNPKNKQAVKKKPTANPKQKPKKSEPLDTPLFDFNDKTT
jgi:hypothetical protein